MNTNFVKSLYFIVVFLCIQSKILAKIPRVKVQNPTTDSLDIMIGQMIMIGIGNSKMADSLSTPIVEAIQNGYVGGVILYEKNISQINSQETLKRMIAKLQSYTKIPLFVSIDEEGGHVNRLKPKYGFPKSVSAQHLGEMGNMDSTRFYAQQTAKLLELYGINMNFAPVVDINLNTDNPVIGKKERSFSSDYKSVIEHAQEVINIHNQYEVIPVLKHFPGHGSSKTDTHLGITDITESWQIEELFPYTSLIDSNSVSVIMTAHIVNKSLDNNKLPATLSKKIIDELLREFMGYQGVVISDDMQMGAIKKEYGTKEAIKMAINAGIDLIMFANNVQDYEIITAQEIHHIIKTLVKEEHIKRERIEESYKRILKLKEFLSH